MSVEELQWYCKTLGSDMDATQRPCFQNEVCNPFITFQG